MFKTIIFILLLGLFVVGCGIADTDPEDGADNLTPGVGGPLTDDSLGDDLDDDDDLVDDDLAALLPGVDWHVRGDIVDFQFRAEPVTGAAREATLDALVVEPNEFLGIGSEYERAVVEITDTTQVWLRIADDTLVEVSASHLALGLDVAVAFDSAPVDADTVEGMADQIVILDELDLRGGLDPLVPGYDDDGDDAIFTPDLDAPLLVLEDDDVTPLRPDTLYHLRGDVVDFQFRLGSEMDDSTAAMLNAPAVIVLEPDALLGIGVPWNRAHVGLNEDTVVWLRVGDLTLTEGSLSDLRVGVDVAVAFDGPVYEAERVEGMASEIIIFDPEELQ